MSRKSRSETKTNQTVTATPTNPEWVTGGVQNLQTRIGGLLDTDASTLVPGASTLQKQAFSAAQGLGGWQPGAAAASGAVSGLLNAPMAAELASAAPATSRSLLEADLDGYMNPYLESVVDTSLAGFDETAGMNRAQLAAQQARGQKFSGSGSAIERALFERGNNQDRTGIEAGLRSSGYDRATDLASRDLDREAQTSALNANLLTNTGQFNAGQANSMETAERDAQLRAAGLLGDLSNATAGNSRADLGLLADLGGQEREIERLRLGAEPALLSLISSLQGQQPYDLFRGQTTNQTGTSTTRGKEYGLGNTIDVAGRFLESAGKGAEGFAALAQLSDKRLKTDIQRVGNDRAGRKVYEYRYKGEPEGVRRTGYMAQEIAKSDPHAVTKIGNRLAVRYGLLDEGIAA